MKVLLHYQDTENEKLHKTLKITLPKSWKNGPTSKLLNQFVVSYNENESLKDEEKLNAASLHLEIRETGASQNDDEVKKHLASDAITVNVIPDRGDVYIVHGQSQTLDDQQSDLKKAKEAKSNLVQCTHFGCQKRFPKGGPYPDCNYHAAPPVFHETAKFWSCCPNKKAYDWDSFQKITGCESGICSEVKNCEEKEFLGGCDIREQLAGAGEPKLKSIDDFNKQQQAGASSAPVLVRLKTVLSELDIDVELFDQVVDGYVAKGEDLDSIAAKIGAKLKSAIKEIAVEHQRIS